MVQLEKVAAPFVAGTGFEAQLERAPPAGLELAMPSVTLAVESMTTLLLPSVALTTG
jgi:hypothetical protein